ncbi:sex-regulated protein janus-A isoform X2 [Nomia melanderi]|uniref:sex-regulated protein janus-A isoform X2 n=1 Tax=Nomia melanderi TaxID=2448451 RepID=UPI0013043873|nr:sex-regulated protein janus-A-like isoform X2 [Nomia melanderi]
MIATIQNFGAGAVTCRFPVFKVLLNSRRFAAMSESLNKVPAVDIDGHGRFKYILINVHDETSNDSKTIVRGYARASWHADIFDETCKQLEPYPSLKPKCLGGGRIEHDPDARTIKVYGYSQGFGKADHEVSGGLLKEKYPDYTITCSDEGY